MIDAAGNPRLSGAPHLHALIAPGQLQFPEPLLTDGLWSLYRNPGVVAANTSVRDVKNMSILAIGALGGIENGDDRLHAGGHVHGSRGDGHNTGNPTVLPEVRPYLRNPSEQIRTAA